ncbi:hypothetical protein PFISCL1PPCAC_645, partial [Pristionchus fissidentatus]
RQWNLMNKADLPAAVDWDKYFGMIPKQAQDWINKAGNQIVLNEERYTSDLFATYLPGRDATVVNYLFIRLILDNSGLIPCSGLPCFAAQRALAEKKVPEHTERSRLPSRRRRPLPSYAILDETNEFGVACADMTSVIADAQARVYVDARFPTQDDKDTIRSSTLGVMTNIVGAMRGMIEQLDWMTDDSKAKAIFKASNIQVNVAFPDFILVNDQLDAKYKDLEFDPDDSFYAMLDKVTVFSISEQFKLLDAITADRGDFLG